jgi:hypothetical protein
MADREQGSVLPTEEEGDRGRVSPLVILPFLALAGLLGCLYVSQAVFKIPVPISPHPDAEMRGGTIRLTWNRVPGGEVTYDVQVAREGPGFQDLFFEKYDIEEHRSPRIPVPKGSTYYWRVRSKSNGEPHRWCDPIAFRMR